MMDTTSITALRHSAFAADWLIWNGVLLGSQELFGVVDTIKSWAEQNEHPWLPFACFYVQRILFLCKDGFYGASPGKFIMGLQVVDKDTLRPIGFKQSFARNLILLLPGIGELAILFLMPLGLRPFDGLANCKVVLADYDQDNHPWFSAD